MSFAGGAGDVREPAARGADLGGARTSKPTVAVAVPRHLGGHRRGPGPVHPGHGQCRHGLPPEDRSRSSWRASRSPCSWRSPRSSSRRSSPALGALGRLSRNPYFNGIASFYVSFFRGTPLLLQILFIYLALPQAGIVLPAVPTAIVALSLNYGVVHDRGLPVGDRGGPTRPDRGGAVARDELANHVPADHRCRRHSGS